MSEDKTDNIPPASVEGRFETSKPVAPPPEVNQKAETTPETINKNDRPRRKRGIMRSFFSHIIVAALAVAGVGGYFHWEDILSQAGGRVCAYEVLGKYGSSQPGAKPVAAAAVQDSTSTSAPEAKSSEAVAPKPADSSTNDTQISEVKVDDNPATKQETAVVATTDSVEKTASINEAAPETNAPKEAEQPKAAEASKSDESDAPNTAPKVAIVSSLDENSFEAELNNARRAYWVDEKAAEKAYLELIAQYPDKADIKGELGNIYVKVGDTEKAASQFLDAGMIWVKSGEKDKATKLVDLLEKLSPEKAASLKEALANAG